MAAGPDRSGYDAVVFAGGGCRCFWQAGFWATAAPALDLRPEVVAGVSAGAAFACASFAGVAERVLEEFQRRVAANPRNAYPENALRGRSVFPHERIYRGTIVSTLDAAALARLRAGPEIRITLSRPPAWSGDRIGFALGLVAYLVEQGTGDRVHAVWGRRLGFRSAVATVRDCRTPDELADLILQSSCTPPITPLYRRGGGIVLDGGLYDAVPVDAVAPARRTLVLLTRPTPANALPRRPGVHYVAPSEPVPVAKWDYTSPSRVARTFELGCRDGERFARGASRSRAA